MSTPAATRHLALFLSFLSVAASVLADEVGPEEIVVTARKIAEPIQDVPLSVHVLAGEYLDQASVSDLFELQFTVPGLVVNTLGGYGAGFSLRGISDQGGSALSVAPYLNGVYLGKSSLAIARVFDMDRIEVLKGPQGTLYGRNSTGGSINFIARGPQDSFSSEIEAGVGSFNTTRVQGFVNLPSDQADFRVAFIGSEGDGSIRNTVDERKFAEDDFWGLRASLRITSGNFTLDFMAQHVEDDGASGELWLPNPAFLPDPKDLQLTTVTLADPYLDTQSDVVSIDAEYDFGAVTLRSITGFAYSEVTDKDDCAGLPFLRGCVREIGPDKYTQWSQEVQLVSAGDSVVEWLAGIYAFSTDLNSHYYLLVPVADPAPQDNEYSTTDETGFAIYGEATIHVADAWSITAGLRHSTEKHEVSNIGTGRLDNPTLTVAAYDWDQPSWRLGLKYAATDDLLFYAGLSTGFKSGGISTNRLPSGAFNSYRPEEVLAYEAGVKSQWLERRLTFNAAAFFYDAKDVQVRTVIIDGGIVYAVTDNAAKAETYGLDTTATFAATERLTLSGSVIWLPKRDFVYYRNDETGDVLSGNRLSRVPEWSASAAIDYEYPLEQGGSLSARLEYGYRSDFFYTKENDPIFRQDGFGLLNALLGYTAPSEKWYLFALGRNLTDEDYFTQVFIQSAPGLPDTYEIGIGLRF